MSEILLQTMRGHLRGVTLARSDVLQREVERGGHVAMTAFVTISNAIAAEGYLGYISGIADGLLMKLQLCSVIGLGLAFYISANGGGEERARAIQLVDNLPIAIKIVNLVCTAVLFFTGQTYMGVICLSIYGLDILDKKGYLPSIIQTVYYKVILNPYLLHVVSIAVGQGITRILSAAVVALSILFAIDKKWNAPSRTPVNLTEPGRLSPARLVELLRATLANEREVQLTCSQEAIDRTVAPLPRVSENLDYEREILELFDNNRGDLEGTISRRMQDNERYQAENARSPIAPLDYARTSLVDILDRVKNRRFNGGVSVNYAEMERCLRILAQYSRQNLSRERIGVLDMLASLSIEVGTVCQTRAAAVIRQFARNVSIEVIMHDPAVPQHAKVKLTFYHMLSTFRLRIFERIYLTCFGGSTIMSNYHMVSNSSAVMGGNMGLPDMGSEEDILSQDIDPALLGWLQSKFIQLVILLTLGSEHARRASDGITLLFREHYTPDAMAGYLREESSFEGRNATINIRDWAYGWIESREEFTRQEKDRLRQELDNHQTLTIGGQTIQLFSDEMRVFRAMMVDMGILI